MQRIDFRVTVNLGPGADEQERSDAVAASRRILIAKEVGTVVRPRSDATSCSIRHALSWGGSPVVLSGGVLHGLISALARPSTGWSTCGAGRLASRLSALAAEWVRRWVRSGRRGNSSRAAQARADRERQ